MANTGSVFGGKPPLSGVERFEQICEQGAYIQDMAYLGEDEETIDALWRELDLEGLKGKPVAIAGGRLICPAINADGEMVLGTTQNTHIEGDYLGLSWAVAYDSAIEGEATSYFCHVIATEPPDTYKDEMLHQITKHYCTYVTVADSTVDILGVEERHRLRNLANDAFTLRIDQAALDEEMSDQEKMHLLFQMFNVILFPDETDSSQEGAEIQANYQHMIERLSYLNSLGMLKGTVVASPALLVRKPGSDDAQLYMQDDANPYIGQIASFGLDIAIFESAEGYRHEERWRMLCLELVSEDADMLSMPVIPGKTKLIESSQESDF